MVHELVHETVNVKGWDICGPVNWEIGEETELPFDEHNPNKNFHYIEGFDTVGTKFMCIGEIVDDQVFDVLFDYLIGNYSPSNIEIL